MKLGATAMPATVSGPLPAVMLPGAVADPRGLLQRAADLTAWPIAQLPDAGTMTAIGDFQRAVLDTNTLAAPAVAQLPASRPTMAGLPIATLVIATSSPLPPALVMDPDEPIVASHTDEDAMPDDAAVDPIREDVAPSEAIVPAAGTEIVITADARPSVVELADRQGSDVDGFGGLDPAATPASPALPSIDAPTGPAVAPTDGPQPTTPVASAAERHDERGLVKAEPQRIAASNADAAAAFALPASSEPMQAAAPGPPISAPTAPVDLQSGQNPPLLPKPPALNVETDAVAVAVAAPTKVAGVGETRPIARVKPVAAAPGDSVLFAVAPAPAAPVAVPPPPAVPVVHISVQPQQLAHDVGRAMVRQIGAAGQELLIRLDPAQLGRIDVRLSFDDLGTLRAVVGAETAQVLDLLRRDSADLGRALADAGVRSDSQSFRFEDRSGDQHHARPQPQRSRSAKTDDLPDTPAADRFQPLRWRGQMNVIA